MIFAIDHWFVSRSDDPRLIVVTDQVDEEADEIFEAARGRAPNDEELTALYQLWIDNEVLYREGLAMQLDKGDPTIRDRVIFKTLSVIDTGLRLPPYDDQVLRQWFESHRTKYDVPSLFDFQEGVISGDNSETAVADFVQALNSGIPPGDAQAGLRIFKGRPYENLVQSYGANFVEALQKAMLGKWQALPTRKGWRAIRLESISSAKPANFEAIRGVVLQDWTDATMAELRTEAVRALAKKYMIKFEVEVMDEGENG